MEIHALKGHRWLIWFLLIALVAGALLVTYISYSNVTGSDNEPVQFIVGQARKPAAKTNTSATTSSATSKTK